MELPGIGLAGVGGTVVTAVSPNLIKVLLPPEFARLLS